jgi:hypothetical protein
VDDGFVCMRLFILLFLCWGRGGGGGGGGSRRLVDIQALDLPHQLLDSLVDITPKSLQRLFFFNKTGVSSKNYDKKQTKNLGQFRYYYWIENMYVRETQKCLFLYLHGSSSVQCYPN